MNGNFDFPVWVVSASYVHQGHFSGCDERMNIQTAQGGESNLFCVGGFWAVLACFGSVSSEYMNIYKGYRNVTSVFAL